MDTDLHWVLGAYERIMRADPHNLRALCETGKALHQLNRPQEARKCYKSAVEVLKRAIRAGDADAALNIETAICFNFVRTIEDENHYYRCFSDWRDDMAKLGRSFRKPATAPHNPNRIAFYLHTGLMLGHTQVMFKIIENIPPARRADLLLRIYVLDNYDQAFLERAEKVGVEVVLAAACLPGGDSSTWLDRFLYLRDRLQRDEMGVCVWVSSPDKAAFTLSMRLAPVQIFWALRFHPITGSYIDGYITYGAKHERERVFGKQKWRVCPVPLAIDTTPAEARATRQLRASFPEKFLLGTLAREDKINSAPFLDAVAKILRQNPDAGFVWTGQAQHAGIDRHWRDAGVAERCHFAGWVDTRLYAGALDLFLETFPLGCGVTGYQALGAGTPLLSYFAPNTVFGMQYWHEFAGAGGAAPESARANHEVLAQYPVLCAKDADDYVALANKIIADPAFRTSIGAAGKRFFDEEINNAGYYSGRFLDTVAEIARTGPDAQAVTS
jgi:glycosyltransferase involved in cell wall biosynthesis